MCYGFYPVLENHDHTVWVQRDFFYDLFRQGKIAPRGDGFSYAKDPLPVLLSPGTLTLSSSPIVPALTQSPSVSVLRWDLVPRTYRQEHDIPLSEMLVFKNSRKIFPGTTRALGFSSYNARMETVAELPSFRKPWQEGLRFITPVAKYRERPNMDSAPHEFRNREYNILLEEGYYLAGLWDEWKNHRSESLLSGTVLTLSSEGNEKIRSIWHERAPVLLHASKIEEWLDPKTTPESARKLCQLIASDHIHVEEVIRPPKTLGSEMMRPDNKLDAGLPGQLDLFDMGE
jgi:putative SOS response-associated peptidase YedK